VKTLIIKLGAAGDVVRTTALLNVLEGDIHWVTNGGKKILLDGNPKVEKCVSWKDAGSLKGLKYDLVINLEDSRDVAELVNELNYSELYGAYVNKSGAFCYTENARAWFDLSIISRFGKEKADQLKLRNRKTYQELVFGGLGYRFQGERYFRVTECP
jgi:heptosyltransferase-2